MRQDPREAFPLDAAQEFEDWCDSIDPPTREDDAPSEEGNGNEWAPAQDFGQYGDDSDPNDFNCQDYEDSYY